jgi:hypothetical protein
MSHGCAASHQGPARWEKGYGRIVTVIVSEVEAQIDAELRSKLGERAVAP